MTAPTPESSVAAPIRLVGRRTYNLLLVGSLLAILWTVWLVLQDSDSFLLGLVAVDLFALLLAGLPAVQFLVYSWRHPPPDVPPLVRRSVYASAGSLAVIGGLYAWFSLTREEPARAGAALGVVVAIVGLAAVLRLLRFKSPGAPVTQLAYARFSAVGLFFFVILAVATPKFACACGSKRDLYKAGLRSDLRNLATAQEAFFADSLRYASTRDLGESFQASTGDSIVVLFASAKGFRAVGWQANLPDTRCGIWVGVAPPDGMHGATEFEPLCWKVN